MTDILRTFIAIKIDLPQSLKELLSELRGMGSGVKTVNEDGTHVTLKFLGETPVESLPEIERSLESVASDCRAFDLELVGTGAFPHWGRPAVFWVGLSPQEPLKEMAQRLEADLEPLGFPKEGRAFHPHLTLARIKFKPPKELKELADAHERTTFGTQTIDRVILYQSDLQQRGPVYTPLATVYLKG